MRLFSIIFIIIGCLFTQTYAVDTSPTSKQITNIIVGKIHKKFKNSEAKETLFLKQIPIFLDKKIEQLTLSAEKELLLKDVSKNIYELLAQKELAKKKAAEQKYLTNIPAYNSFLKVADNEDFIFLENGVWYYYNFTAGRSFPSKSDITIENMKFSNIDPTNSILLYHRKSSKVMIVEPKYYTKKKIVSNSVIYGVADKYSFIKRIKKDLYFQGNSNADAVLTSIQKKADSLSIGKTKNETILAFYGFILENMDYSQDLTKQDVYSGLAGFGSGDGVCESYVTSMEYLLWLSGFHDVEFMPGDVIDSVDFPKIGHAWIRIGNKYYDPTFDDPVGAAENKKPENYKYFGLSRDLFYTNRYDLGTTPAKLKTETLEFRKAQVQQNLAQITKKYAGKGEPLLREVEFRIKYGFNQFESLTQEKLKKVFKSHLVVDNYKITNSSSKKIVNKIQYFTLTSAQDVGVFLEQIHYDVSGYNLFLWTNETGILEYRISNDYELK